MRLTAAGIGKFSLLLFCSLACMMQAIAQTDADAIMMSKNNFCVGGMYGYSSWKNYWEGTLKRDNQNLGTVSSQMYAVMGNYGISKKLNVLFGLPYIQTKASAGTLHGQKGIQDLSLWLKYMPVEKEIGSGVLSVYGIGGVSFPVSNYVCDYLPLAIGLHSTNVTLRAMVDYQLGSFFATVSGSYIIRSNIKIDRDSYYTTEMHYSNKVEMPNMSQFNLRIGYRTDRMILEALLGQSNTLGGFDITRNNMPFPSNKMNMTAAGLGFKYNVKPIDGLSIVGSGNYTLAGRNVGQATAFNGGIFYILAFKHHKKSTSNTPDKK
ncbi:MAG: hypothetical protein QM726_25810 [Chitinophagaceae bacterium]